jgi:dolichyl-phosphate beta-glucosyltransferase
MSSEGPRRGIDISVVVPCYNEVERLPMAVAGVEEYLRERGCDYELVLVDDGSSDGTPQLLRRLVTERPAVRIALLTPNRGKGRAVAEGVRLTTGDLVLVSDADFSAPIEELPKLERAITEGADIALGSRAAPGARELDQPLHRRAMGKAFNKAVQALVLPGILDTQCGFKLFRGRVARGLFSELVTDGFAFDVEILVAARRRRLRLTEVPVRWIYSGSSRVSPVRHSAEMARDLLRMRLSAPRVA